MRRTATVRLDRPLTEAAELARRAEDLGFDGVWVADHYFHRDATGALALMAAATTRVRLGTAVVSPLLRHPALLAGAAASLAEISDGRFILGLGAGGYELASELGITAARPLAVVAEAVRVVRGLHAGRADVSGQVFSAHGSLRFTPRPTPVYLAARGPKMLRLAGRVADGVITHGLSARHIGYVIDQLSAGAGGAATDSGTGAGTDGAGAATGGAGGAGAAQGWPAIVLMLDVQIDADRTRALDDLRPRCVTMAGGSYADELVDVYGLRPDDVARLRAALRAGDRAGAVRLVTDEMVDAFGIAGPVAHLAERLDELARAGVDEVILSVDGGDLATATAHLTDLAKAVLA